jgi:predicted DNA-binding transcriptional regulator YafY
MTRRGGTYSFSYDTTPHLISGGASMTIHGDTLVRQWQILRLIPRLPQKRTATEILHSLNNDQEVSKRTIERDLVALSSLFPIVSDEREKPYGWSWAQDAPSIDIPAMTDAEAIAFKLVELHLGHLLPRSYRQKLAPYFTTAAKRLKSARGTEIARSLAEKIRIVQPRRGLVPASIRPEVQDAVLEALLKERKLRIAYLRNLPSAPEIHLITPCALVQFWGRTRLVASLDGIGFEVFKLHRVQWAEVQAETAAIPKDFDVDRYLFPHSFQERAQEGVAFRFVCTPQAAETIIDQPIGIDQRVLFDGDRRAWVEAIVPVEAKKYLEDLARENGILDDMDIMLYHNQFWNEGQPVFPIGGLEG